MWATFWKALLDETWRTHITGLHVNPAQWWIVTVDQFSRQTLTLTSCNLCLWRCWCRRTCNLHHCFSVTYTFKGLRLQLINPFWEQLKNCNHLSKTLSRPKNVQFGVGAQLSFTHKFAIIKLCLKRHFMSFVFLQQQHWKLGVWLGCPNWVVSWVLAFDKPWI